MRARGGAILPAATGRRTPLPAPSSHVGVALLLGALAAATAARAQERGDAPAATAATPTSGRLRYVRIDTVDVFAPTDRGVLRQAVNALHYKTRADTVRRELWFRPGDHVDDQMAAELERNLRALGLFAVVEARLVATGTPGEVDMEVTTRDRLTLNVGAGGSYVGGVSGFRTSLGESNFLGLGDRVAGSFTETSDGEYRGAFAYSDLHVLDTWHTANVRLGRTEEGDSASVDVRRPFKFLVDPRSYGGALAHEEAAIDYFRGGESVAEIPYRRNAFDADMAWGDGPREQRRFVGVTLAAEDVDYDTATGVQAADFDGAADHWSVFLGPTVSWQWIDGFRKVEGLDTLDYVQDLVLGPSLSFSAGGRGRDAADGTGGLQPEMALGAGLTAEPIGSVYTNLGVRGAIRYDDGDAVGWTATGQARAFALVHDRHTIAASAVFDGVEESQDVLRELTLGEDNGLRGYRTRLLSGTRRVRCNLEHRFDTGLDVATVRLGLLAFHDVGWVGEGGALGEHVRSAGVGARLGSPPLLGDALLRIDVAKPLDRVDGEDRDWQVSVTVGQVFTFGGNLGRSAR
jgi:hypothetical protein